MKIEFVLTSCSGYRRWYRCYSAYDPIFQLQYLNYSTGSFLICMPLELRSAQLHLEIVNPHHPQKSH